MVAVAAHELLQVARDVFLERVALRDARSPVPLVEALVPHEDSHLVAEVENLLRRRVVRRPERVYAHVLHDFELATHRALVERHAKRPEVGMEVHALELHAASVQVEPVVRRELGGADAVFVLLPADRRLVELRVRDIPENGTLDLELVDNRARAHWRKVFDAHLRALRRYLGSRDLDRPPYRAVFGIFDDKRDVAIQSRARVPAAVVLRRVGLDEQLVLLAELELRGDVDLERHVAVVPAADLLAVQEHLWARHHAAEP